MVNNQCKWKIKEKTQIQSSNFSVVEKYKKFKMTINSFVWLLQISIKFDNTKNTELWQKMNKQDQDLFQFKLDSYNWYEYLCESYRVTRRDIFHESEDTLPFARRKLVFLKVLDYTINILVIYFLFVALKKLLFV